MLTALVAAARRVHADAAAEFWDAIEGSEAYLQNKGSDPVELHNLLRKIVRGYDYHAQRVWDGAHRGASRSGCPSPYDVV